LAEINVLTPPVRARSSATAIAVRVLELPQTLSTTSMTRPSTGAKASLTVFQGIAA
jgi:hypothetical protein